jgi:hypothetical protein
MKEVGAGPSNSKRTRTRRGGEDEPPRKRLKVEHAAFDFLNWRWGLEPSGDPGPGSHCHFRMAHDARSAIF